MSEIYPVTLLAARDEDGVEYSYNESVLVSACSLYEAIGKGQVLSKERYPMSLGYHSQNAEAGKAGKVFEPECGEFDDADLSF